jgi:hypothetical protein
MKIAEPFVDLAAGDDGITDNVRNMFKTLDHCLTPVKRFP